MNAPPIPKLKIMRNIKITGGLLKVFVLASRGNPDTDPKVKVYLGAGKVILA